MMLNALIVTYFITPEVIAWDSTKYSLNVKYCRYSVVGIPANTLAQTLLYESISSLGSDSRKLWTHAAVQLGEGRRVPTGEWRATSPRDINGPKASLKKKVPRLA